MNIATPLEGGVEAIKPDDFSLGMENDSRETANRNCPACPLDFHDSFSILFLAVSLHIALHIFFLKKRRPVIFAKPANLAGRYP